MIYKAPLDNKNVMTDWIEEVFDNYSGIESKKRMLGFVDDFPVYAHWEDNVLIWEVLGCEHPETVIATLSRRLKKFECDEEDGNNPTKLHSQKIIVRNTLVQSFFFETED